MTLDRTELVVVLAAVAAIGFILWYFFGGKR